MKKNQIVDYDLTINDFTFDVNDWLNARVPRDDDDVRAINDTKEMWRHVMANPIACSKYDILYSYVCDHERGFIVKHGINNYDNSMLFAVNDVLIAMEYYYDIGDEYQKQELANAIKKYKMLRAKNAFERFKLSMMNPQKLLSTRQR